MARTAAPRRSALSALWRCPVRRGIRPAPRLQRGHRMKARGQRANRRRLGPAHLHPSPGLRLCGVFLALWIGFTLSIAQAASPYAQTEPDAVAPCDAANRLASVIQAEAYSQPDEAHVAIAQIVANEAQARGMTVCELTERTWFVSVFRYGLSHPSSWTARQFVNVQPWAYDIAQAVLDGAIADATGGARHFDGAPCGYVLWTAGQTFFCE